MGKGKQRSSKKHVKAVVEVAKRKRKESGETEKMPMQRVRVVGKNGKTTLQWRPW